MPEVVSLRDRECKRIAATLRYVADNIGRYMPREVCLEGSEFVVRVPNSQHIPTVGLDAEMPAQIIFKRTD